MHPQKHMNAKTRPHGIETRKRLERLRLKSWTPASAPRAPEAPPMATALQRIASALAAMQGTAPARPAVAISLAAAAAQLKGGRP